MAHLQNRGNAADYRRALAHIHARPGDRILELGFGGGFALPALLETRAHITAVEPAVAMRERAIRKHARAIATGSLVVQDGAAECLPDGPFQWALSMNTAYFWSDVDAAMSELARTVRGTVLLGIGSVEHLETMGFRESGFRVESPEWYGRQLEQVGFTVTYDRTDTSVSTLVIGQAS